MEWVRSLMLPVQGSEFAKRIDSLYMFIFWLSVVLFVAIVFFTFYFAWAYRARPGRVTEHIAHNAKLELAWTIIPLFICVGLFFWGVHDYTAYSVAPGDAMQIQVTGKKWLWAFEYPDGSRYINDIHIPIGKTVQFVMTSEDVLHDFYVPTMRVKHDVVPGRYTSIWFTPTVPGLHRVACAEYCGKGHSDMAAKIHVDTPAEYEKWLKEGPAELYTMKPEEVGKLQWEQKGCNTCHSVDGSRGQGPTWKGIWGQKHKMKDGAEILVDENYIRESIVEPQKHIVQGYEPIMPTFQGLLREVEMRGIIAYIKSLE